MPETGWTSSLSAEKRLFVSCFMALVLRHMLCLQFIVYPLVNLLPADVLLIVAVWTVQLFSCRLTCSPHRGLSIYPLFSSTSSKWEDELRTRDELIHPVRSRKLHVPTLLCVCVSAGLNQPPGSHVRHCSSPLFCINTNCSCQSAVNPLISLMDQQSAAELAISNRALLVCMCVRSYTKQLV